METNLPQRSRLAVIQGLVVAGLIAASVVAAVLAWRFGAPVWSALLIGMMVMFGHAWVLAVEFALLSRVAPGPGVPRPTALQLLRAWWGEVRTGSKVFAWRQPFQWRRFPDAATRARHAGRRGVVLVHGFVCNRGLWNPWLARLDALGTPFVAVNLEPVFGAIDRYVPLVEDAVARMEGATGCPPLVVAHSMGGLAVRQWLDVQGEDSRVHHVITIGSPHHGTWLARFALTPNSMQMRHRNPWLAALAAQESASRRNRFTCFYSHCDNIVFPASTATLDGADNRHLPGVAHVDLVYQPAVWNEVLRRLVAAPAPASAG